MWIDVTAGTDVDGTVVIDVPTPTGQPVVRYGAPVRAAAGAPVRVFVPAIFFESRTPGTVHLEAAGHRLASQPLPRVRPVDEIVVVLSSEPLGAEATVARTGRVDVAYVAAEMLPPVWQTYEAVRLLVVRTLDERRLDDAQRIAVRDWVWTGGRILMMPEGDDTRHLSGPTLGPLRRDARAGRLGRGHVIVWTRDPADPSVRGNAADVPAWETVLEAGAVGAAPSLEPAVPAGRPVPLRVHLVAGAMILLYVLLVRRVSRFLALLQPVPVATFVVMVLVATAAAVRLSVLARRDASGVVSATMVEMLPGTGHGLLRLHARVVSSHGGAFAITAPPGVLVRPAPPASVTIVTGPTVQISGQGAGLQLSGVAVVPLPVSGTYHAGAGGVSIRITNRSGRRIEHPWVYMDSRVQMIAPIGESAQVSLDASRWQPADRLQRTEPHHPLLVWTFLRLESDAILRGTRNWLVGWWRDPALALMWDGRPEAPLQLILVPLSASP